MFVVLYKCETQYLSEPINNVNLIDPILNAVKKTIKSKKKRSKMINDRQVIFIQGYTNL